MTAVDSAEADPQGGAGASKESSDTLAQPSYELPQAQYVSALPVPQEVVVMKPEGQAEAARANSIKSFDSRLTEEKVTNPRNYRRACLCLTIILVVIGAVVGVVIYFQTASKPGKDPSAPTECFCGYTDSQTGKYYTNYIKLDFTQLSDISKQYFFHVDTEIVSAASIGGTYNKQYDPRQVSVDKNGLSITVLPFTANANNAVLGGQLASYLQTIQYGTFRTVMKLPTQPGTCASMFFYHDKLNEIDLEFLGSYANANASANSFYGTQTGDPNQIDNPAAWKRVPYVADQTSAFKEYRFDWGPGAIDYYMNGAKQHTATAGVPAVGGSLILNHWSGGSSGWEL
ncbi:hypothetical protein HDV03_002294, partial [Kappamyces sp. JEL0829]